MALQILTIPTSDKKEAPLKYPCLKVHHGDGIVVLFTEPRQGTVVKGSPDKEARGTLRLGYFSSSWNEENFVPFYGTLSLTQEKEYV